MPNMYSGPGASFLMHDLADFGLPEVPLLGHYRFYEAKEALRPHSHAGTMEICFLTQGRQVYRVAGQDYVIRGGEVFVTAPDEEHDSGGKPQEPGELYWMHLCSPVSGGEFLGFDVRAGTALAAALMHLPVHRVFAAPSSLQGRFEAMFQLVADLADPEKLRAALATCLGDIVLSLAGSSRELPSPSDSMNELLKFIEAHLADPLSVEMLAVRLGLSPSWFKARFKQEVGMPPGTYLLHRRVVRAQALLTSGGSSVTTIALELGFSSSQYFATVFRRFTGQTPKEYVKSGTGSKI